MKTGNYYLDLMTAEYPRRHDGGSMLGSVLLWFILLVVVTMMLLLFMVIGPVQWACSIVADFVRECRK